MITVLLMSLLWWHKYICVETSTTGTEEGCGGKATTMEMNFWSSTFHSSSWFTTTRAYTAISGYISGWPDSASVTLVVVLLVVVVLEFIALLFTIIYVIKKRARVHNII